MLKRFMPQEEKFFDLFARSAQELVAACRDFEKMIANLDQAEAYAKAISDCEHRADAVTHRTVSLLHKTFITPLDREDIHLLICRLDDVLDLVEAAAHRIVLYEITSSTPEMVEFARICLASAELIERAVAGLDNLKKPDELLKICIDLNRLENEADQVLRQAVARLFREENDVKKLIKLKETYELLEEVTDKCEDVANIVEGIVLEYA